MGTGPLLFRALASPVGEELFSTSLDPRVEWYVVDDDDDDDEDTKTSGS